MIFIQRPDGTLYRPYRERIVGGTEGLLAITISVPGEWWHVTHAPTGCCFGNGFADADDAMTAAVCLWLRYQRDQLRATEIRDVVAGYSRRMVATLMEVAT